MKKNLLVVLMVIIALPILGYFVPNNVLALPIGVIFFMYGVVNIAEIVKKQRRENEQDIKSVRYDYECYGHE